MCALLARVKRLEKTTRSCCPRCADWPDEIELTIVEVLVERGPDGQLVEIDDDGTIVGPAPATGIPQGEEDSALKDYGPCPGCGRVHRPKVTEISRERSGSSR
jgi:hypothetical protein